MKDESGRVFVVEDYGIGSRKDPHFGTYEMKQFRGRLDGKVMFLYNEQIPQATGGPWSSSPTLFSRKYRGHTVKLHGASDFREILTMMNTIVNSPSS